jgi:L-ascorbate metabolism protein UlaG (beta-lactamase superfamily)
MTTRLRFLGVACFEADGPFGRVLFDPFLTGNPVAPVGPEELAPPDVIVISHAAPDHMADAAAVALRTGAAVVCGAEVAELLAEQGVPSAQLRPTVWGIRVRMGQILVAPVESHHWSVARLSDGRLVTGTPMGFVVTVAEDCRIYHFGDTAIFSDLRLIGELHRPTVALLGCTQPWSLVAPGAGKVVTGEMSPDEAALAAELLGAPLAVACHYEQADHPDVEAFRTAVAQRDTTGQRQALALRAGQVAVLDKDQYELEIS